MKNFLLKLFMLFALCGSELSFPQVNWTKHPGNPIFSGPSGSWYRHVFQPNVLYNADSSRYEMWFGTGGLENGNRPYRIGFAFSYDRIEWTVHPNAVLNPEAGKWDAYSVEAPYVIRENDTTYKMWYSGCTSFPAFRIGYATSKNGIDWIKHSGNPIMGPGTASWEEGIVLFCSVVKETFGYKMWYSGGNAAMNKTNIGYATSTDGITWQRDTLNNPVVRTGNPPSWDEKDLLHPRVMFLQGRYYLWYGGGGNSTQFPASIGLATSSDGITDWDKVSVNPVLAPSIGQWDGVWIEGPSVIYENDSLFMWYAGFQGSLFRIGLATSGSFTPVSVEQSKTQPTDFLLEQNYPNPFNPSTTIKYSIPKASRVQLLIFNLLGEEVATVVDDEKSSGSYSIMFNARNLPSGIYFYQLKSGNFVQTRKMILMK